MHNALSVTETGQDDTAQFELVNYLPPSGSTGCDAGSPIDASMRRAGWSRQPGSSRKRDQLDAQTHGPQSMDLCRLTKGITHLNDANAVAQRLVVPSKNRKMTQGTILARTE